MKNEIFRSSRNMARFAACLALLFCCRFDLRADDPHAAKIIGGGPFHAIAANPDGTVLTWGYNGYGTLGDGTTTDRHSPVFAIGLTNIISIGGGGVYLSGWSPQMFSAGLRADGGVMTWGNNDFGQLGNGTTTASNVAVRVSNLTNIVALGVGGYHSLGLKGDGTVMAWGYGLSGGLGNGANTNSTVPVTVTNLTNIIAVAGGGQHSVALRSDGMVMVWGDDSDYELGDGTVTSRNTPMVLPGISNVVAIASRGTFTVGLKADGTVWQWGGYTGGTGGTITPTKLNLPSNVVAIIAANDHQNCYGNAVESDGTLWFFQGPCELPTPGGAAPWTNFPPVIGGAFLEAAMFSLSADGAVWVNGTDQYGQLGNGITIAYPGNVSPEVTNGVTGLGPAYQNHTVIRKSDGTVYAWGANWYGQVGDGTTNQRSMPVALTGLMDITAASAGVSHSVASKADGTVWTWGANLCGQLGDGTTTNRPSPVQVSGLTNIVTVAAGAYHSLGITASQTVVGWGDNLSGQLGDGTMANRSTPVAVSNLSGVIAVAAGSQHSIALTTNKTVWAWGQNIAGQLGDGTMTNRLTPVSIAGVSNVIAIAAGHDHTLALDTNGTVWAWGYNAYGQLGLGDTTNRSSPTAITNLSGVVAIACGGEFSAAVTANGNLWMWGRNLSGQLGVGDTTNRSTPVLVISTAAVSNIVAGDDHVVALMTDGTMRVWGGNLSGQLGLGTGTNQPLPLRLDAFRWQATPYAPLTLNSLATNSARYIRGSAGDPTYQSFIIPIDFEEGVKLDDVGSNASKFSGAAPWFTRIQKDTRTHVGLVSSVTNGDGSLSNTYYWNTNFENPITAFGSSGGGSSLFLNQNYNFGVYAGAQYESTNAAGTNFISPVRILVYRKSDFIPGQTNVIAPFATNYVTVPRRTIAGDQTAWNQFATNGFTVTIQTNGLSTTLQLVEEPTWSPLTNGLTTLLTNQLTNVVPTNQLTWNQTALTGIPGPVQTNAEETQLQVGVEPTVGAWGVKEVFTNARNGPFILTHQALSQDYCYVVEAVGIYPSGTNAGVAVVSAGTTNLSWDRLYSLDFDITPIWRSVFIDQPQFNGQPLPPDYLGESVAELQSNLLAVMTNVIVMTNSLYTNLDNSPELRRHPTLDSFVQSMNNDPMALANYVQNNIELTDALTYNENTGQASAPSINQDGISRNALGVYLEGQGSPMEQCALLVYLLRQAGYPAAYVFPTNSNIQMLDTRLSTLLRMQFKGAVDQYGNLYTTNSLITVNYPWVVTQIGTNCVHLFPWLKDTVLEEGLDLYDYLPTNYNSGEKWFRNYLFADPNILSLSIGGDTPATLFPAFVSASLTNFPGISLDDIGMRVGNRQHFYSRWQDFPTPNVVSNQSQVVVVDSLTSSAITNVSPLMTASNLFNTLDVQVYSLANTNSRIDTLDLRMADLLDRKFLVFTNQNTLQLWLAPFVPGNTNQSSFGTSDPALTNGQVLTLPLTNGNLFGVTISHKRHKAVSAAAAPTSSYPGVYEQLATTQSSKFIQTNDVMAICFHVGRVSSKMVDLQAQSFWQMEAQKNSNTNYVPGTPDYQGTAAYLMGMDYFNKVGRFTELDERLHKVHVLSWYAEGLFKLTSIVSNSTTLVQPSMDMYLNEVVHAGNGTTRMDSGGDLTSGMDDFMTLLSGEIGAQEHNVLNGFYSSTNAVSSVMLLRIAQQKASPTVAGILELSRSNYVTMGNTASTGYGGTLLMNYDPGLWSVVTNQFGGWDADYVRVFITPAPMTSYSGNYKGMGAVIQGRSQAAFLASINMNGGGGFGHFGWDDLDATLVYYNDPTTLITYDDPYYGTADTGVPDYFYTYGDFGAYTAFSPVSYSWNKAPATSTTVVLQPAVNINDPSSVNLVGVPTTVQTLAAQRAANEMYLTGQTTDALIAKQESVGNLGGKGFWHQAWDGIKDPVSPVTGAFHDDALDLSIGGPVPLEIRRNYSSQNVSGENNFGFGWKLNYSPYLQVATNTGTNFTNVVLYAAETDGSVLTYRQQTNNTNLFIPTLSDNPDLDNNSRTGIGSTANLFNASILRSQAGTNITYTLTGPDGSVRVYQVRDYPSIGKTNQISRLRPYLSSWQDNAGNLWSFSFGTNTNSFDYGQLNRVQCGNGNFVTFTYNDAGFVTGVMSGDDRMVEYTYDNFGDLTGVMRPDGSEVHYAYGRYLLTNGSTVYIDSSHLLQLESKPDGRQLQNAYDSSRRVTAQASTVGPDLNLYTNAVFAYSNSFNYTNEFTNLVSGYTLVTDVNGNVTRFDYTNGLITKVTDPLNQTIVQNWYFTNDSSGGYQRSLKYSVDKRGLTNSFAFDTNGNVLTNVLTGTDLTGDGQTNATTAFTYTNHNLIASAVDPVGNTTKWRYNDTNYPWLPTSAESYASNGSLIASNTIAYTNVSGMVTNGSVVVTNAAFGLICRTIRAAGSGDAATNDFFYDGRGFAAAHIAYSGTSDPNVTNYLYFDGRGDLVQVMDAAGRYTLFQNDEMHRPITRDVFDTNSTAPVSSESAYYNENGELTWYDGPRYNPEDYVWRDYDGAGREIQEIHWRSRAKADGTGVEAETGDNLYATTFFEYDEFGNQVHIYDQLGNAIRRTFDAIGQTTSVHHYGLDDAVPLAVESFGYEPGGQVASYTNALGGVTQNFYTTTGRLKQQINPDGSSNLWTFDLSGRTVKQVAANGNYWQTAYDDANRRVTQVFHNASTTLATNIAQLDRRGNVIQTTDPLGNVFTNLFDGLDRLKIAAGPPIANVTAVGNPPTSFVTNFTQQATTYIFDGIGRVLTVTNAVGETTVAISDALNRPTQLAIYNAGGGTPVRVTSAFYSPDHQSVTITNGTGAGAIVTTTYTDTEGNPVLGIGYPTNGITEFVSQQFDVAGRRIGWQQLSSSGGVITTWATNGWTYDALNRVLTATGRDGAATVFGYDALGDVTSRALPGGLTWSASYLNDGRLAGEQESGGSQTSRSMTYSYYQTGSPFVGNLKTITDGRGTTRTNSYDDFLRLASVTSTGSSGPQQTLTTYQYDLRDLLTSVSQSFNNSTNGPATTVSRGFDSYGRTVYENVSVASNGFTGVSQSWDLAGRRSSLSLSSGLGLGFYYQADGLMTTADGSSFGYGNNGLLTGRTNSSRSYTVNQRDGVGRVLQTTTTAGIQTLLTENLSWLNNGQLNSYTAARGDFTDSRNYGYSTLARRVTQESFNLAASQKLTNTYIIDGGQTGGLGTLTSSTQSGVSSASWAVASSGGLDGLGRVAQAQDSLINRSTYGTAIGAGSVSATLDGKSIGVQFDGPQGGGQWRANMDLAPGSHTLLVNAVDPSGHFSGAATNTFASATNSGDAIQNTYDGSGNITQRVWVNTLNQTNRTQTLTWDAFDRLIGIVDRDAAANGFNWTAVYDALGRRLLTLSTMVVSNTPVTTLNSSNTVSEVDSWYDPEVEFLEVGVAVNGQPSIKTYGPDANGVYGGMQGVGGLEDVYEYGHLSSTAVVQDFFGNVLASVKNGTVTWNPARFGSYGPVPGYSTPALSSDTTLEQALGWRGKRVDESGLVYMNARYLDPVAGRFISHDPVFDPDSPDGFAFAGSDPVNGFDPTGRFGVGAWQSGKGLVTGFGTLFYNVGGTIGYGVSSAIDAGFGSDLSSTYQDEWDAIKGTGRGIKTLGGQAVHGQFGQIGSELTGGEGRSGAYRTGYAGVAIASLFTGGEFAEAGNVGKVAEVAEVSSQAAMRARVLTELAESPTQLEFGFAKGDLSGKLTSFESAAKTDANLTRGWNVGDPINNLTSKGNVPAWSTVRQRFWKNEVLNNPEAYDAENLARMQKGLAPQRVNPETELLESKELHHTPAQRNGGLFDVQSVWPDEHAAIDPFRHTGN